METSELKADHWYSFVEGSKGSYGGIADYCKYVGAVLIDNAVWDVTETRHRFRHLNGHRFSRSGGSAERFMKPCSKSFSKYLNLFGPKVGNENR